LLSKDYFVQKTSKSNMMTSYVWHCFCTYCTKNTDVYCISALSFHTASCRAQQCWKQDQKYKTKTKTEAGLRSVLS